MSLLLYPFQDTSLILRQPVDHEAPPIPQSKRKPRSSLGAEQSAARASVAISQSEIPPIFGREMSMHKHVDADLASTILPDVMAIF
jgi:hypothetical protein